jgi:8-oxo-dGTP pyrophosphatase MutT (NUDIX family)
VKNWKPGDIEQLFKKPLPGEEAHLKMAPLYRGRYTKDEIKNFNPKIAAVLALFYFKHDEWHLVFTERMTYPGVHSGQISFPGGKQEMGEDLFQTALRETYEEVGVAYEAVRLVGKLTDIYVPPSNFEVHPFVAISESEIKFKRQVSEVNQILEIPVSFFLSPESISKTEIILPNQSKFEVPAYVYEGKVIWGATAIILSELITLIQDQ